MLFDGMEVWNGEQHALELKKEVYEWFRLQCVILTRCDRCSRLYASFAKEPD